MSEETLWRTKWYRLNNSGHWDDLGTYFTSLALDESVCCLTSQIYNPDL